MNDEVYRTRVWLHDPDAQQDPPAEVYWLNADACTDVVSALLEAKHFRPGTMHVRSIEIAPVSELPLAELLAGHQESLF